MPFANQGDDCDMRGSWHQSPMISTFRDRTYKPNIFGNSSYQSQFQSSVYFHDGSAPSASFSQYYGAHYDSKSGVLPDHNPFRHSSLRNLRTRNASERQVIEPAISCPRVGSVRREYDMDDVFCPSYVDRDAAKVRSQQHCSTSGNDSKSLSGSHDISPTTLKLATQAETERSVDSNDASFKANSLDEDEGKGHYNVFVDSEAERALLLSMGWQEATSEDPEGDISQQEIDDFYRLLRSSRPSSNHRTRFAGNGRIRHLSDQTSSTPGLSTGSTPAQAEVFDEKCLSDDIGLSSDDSLSVDEND